MSKRFLICILISALFLAACGGGKGTPVVQPATQPPIAEPSPGARYSGPIDMGEKAKQATLSFQVSQDGAAITALELSFKELQCEGFSAGQSFKREEAIHPIRAGKFQIASDSFGNLSGEFASPQAASGTIELKLDLGLGGEPIDCGNASFNVVRVPGESGPAPAEIPIASTEPAAVIPPTPTEVPVTEPQPGASFGGPLTLEGQEGSAMLTFQVSEDGKSISYISLMLMSLQCGELNTGITILQETSSLPIDAGVFQGTFSKVGEIEGEFTSPMSAHGQMNLRFDYGLGGDPIECGTATFDVMLMPETTETVPGETPVAPTEPAAAIPASPPPLLTPLDLPNGDIAVVNVYSTEEGDELYILGEVENRTPGFIANIHLTAEIFDSNGGKVTEADEHAKQDELAPGERGPFVIIIPKPASFASFSLKVDSDPRGSSPPIKLRVTDQIIERLQYGGIQVSGMVENGTPDNLQYVMVVGVFYDTEGRVIGVGSNFPVGPDEILVPGKRAPFQFNPKPSNMGDYTNYRLIMTNNQSVVDFSASRI